MAEVRGAPAPCRAKLVAIVAASAFVSVGSTAWAEEASTVEPSVVRVGVLAKRGIARAVQRWQPTVEYLSAALPKYRFELVPLDFQGIESAARAKRVEFILSNPAYFVDLERNHGARAIATLVNGRGARATAAFGGVIFRRSDREDIGGLEDLRSKRFMAVDPRSFGGWHVGWYRLRAAGIQPKSDFERLEFGGTHDEVVYAVRDGRVDAGTVRTDTLERMAREGKISLDTYRILGSRADDAFPFRVSTTLYPEWPFACLPHVERELTELVTVALLRLPRDHRAATAANAEGWTTARNYQPVHECLRALRQPPYEAFGVITWRQALQKEWQLLVGLVLVLLLVVIFSLRMKGLNRALSSALRLLDAELSQRREAEASLGDFKRTLDQVHDCVFIFDAETLRFQYVNQGAVQQVGYSSEEFLHMTPLDIAPGSTERDFRALLGSLVEASRGVVTYSTEYRRKDGELMPVEVMLQYVVPGREGRFVAVVRDIGDRLRSEKEKDRLQAQLLQAQKLESVGRLAAGIAHEINTPIQFISSNVRFLSDAYQEIAPVMNELNEGFRSSNTLDSAGCEALRAALEEADWEYLAEEIPRAISETGSGVQRVSSIVLAMKKFSHPGQEGMVATCLNEIVETTLVVARNELKYVAEVSTDLDPQLPAVPCLSDELGQVVLNILVNAAHAITEKVGASGDDVPLGSIHISTRRVASGVQMRIQDDGCGMSNEVRERIFEPFFTTKEVGRGTGQGLAICHDVVVDKHGGVLEVETQEGVGTTFIVVLPSE